MTDSTAPTIGVGDRVSLEARIFFDEGTREGVALGLLPDDRAVVEFPWPGGRPDDVMRIPAEVKYLKLVRSANPCPTCGAPTSEVAR